MADTESNSGRAIKESSTSDASIVRHSHSSVFQPTAASRHITFVRWMLFLSLMSLNAADVLQVTDAGLAIAGQHMPSLRVLYLSYCRQTGDAGLEHVLKMNKLEELDLYNTPCVSAAAVARVARYVQLTPSSALALHSV